MADHERISKFGVFTVRPQGFSLADALQCSNLWWSRKRLGIETYGSQFRGRRWWWTVEHCNSNTALDCPEADLGYVRSDLEMGAVPQSVASVGYSDMVSSLIQMPLPFGGACDHLSVTSLASGRKESSGNGYFFRYKMSQFRRWKKVPFRWRSDCKTSATVTTVASTVTV